MHYVRDDRRRMTDRSVGTRLAAYSQEKGFTLRLSVTMDCDLLRFLRRTVI